MSSIRPALHRDMVPVLALLEGLHPGDRGPSAADGDERIRAVWDAVLNQEGRVLLVAEDERELVGTADLIVMQNLTRDARPWAIVENLVVTSERRREGIGRALMNEALARARAAGCYKVQLLSRRTRAEAHAFYAELGFEPLAEGFRRYL